MVLRGLTASNKSKNNSCDSITPPPPPFFSPAFLHRLVEPCTEHDLFQRSRPGGSRHTEDKKVTRGISVSYRTRKNTPRSCMRQYCLLLGAKTRKKRKRYMFPARNVPSPHALPVQHGRANKWFTELQYVSRTRMPCKLVAQ